MYHEQNYPLPPSPLLEDIKIATDDRVFFLTRNGSMGLGPASMLVGDTIHILPSGSAHFVLRSRPSGLPRPCICSNCLDGLSPEHFELIGDCYVHTVPQNQRPTEAGLAVEGSLPFELLGEEYFRKRGLPSRDYIFIV